MVQATGKSLEFIEAAENGDLEELKALWRDHKGEIDLDARDGGNEWAVLHDAINLVSQDSANNAVSQDSANNAVSQDSANNAIDFLLKIGCDPDARTGNDQNASCLILVGETGNVYVLERLIEALKHKYKSDPEKYKEALTFVGGNDKETAQETAERKNNNGAVLDN